MLITKSEKVPSARPEHYVRSMPVALLVVALMITQGCASWGVEPWERGVLAKEEMQIGSAPLDAALDDHIYFSKEATSGGRGFGGGGCGCN